MFDSIASDTAGQSALSRFFTTNTWNAQQIFKASGTQTPAAIFQATGTTSTSALVDANAIVQFQGTEAVASHVLYDAAAAPTHVYFRRTNGTYATRTAIANADILGSLQWQGYGTSTYGTTIQAQIRATASQAFTDAVKGTSLEFYVTPIGTATNSIGLRLSNGTLLTGHNAEFFGTLFLKNATGINFESVAGVSESVLGLSNANNVGLASPTVSGGIIISTRATNGTIQLTAGTSTGVITLATGGATRLTISSSGLATFSNQLIASDVQLNNSAGTTRTLFFRTAGSTRWTLQASSEAETGVNNAGSNFHLRRYSDSQVDLGIVLAINRSTGVTTLGADRFNLSTAVTGITASGSAGTMGDIAWDDTYLYVRMSTGWRRIALGGTF